MRHTRPTLRPPDVADRPRSRAVRRLPHYLTAVVPPSHPCLESLEPLVFLCHGSPLPEGRRAFTQDVPDEELDVALRDRRHAQDSGIRV
jgi:hypothetical protein